MTDEKNKEYVIKSGKSFWNGKRWGPCIRCALRLTREEAHTMAHKDNGEGWAVKRVRPKHPRVKA